jgi:hypothetical protein
MCYDGPVHHAICAGGIFDNRGIKLIRAAAGQDVLAVGPRPTAFLFQEPLRDKRDSGTSGTGGTRDRRPGQVHKVLCALCFETDLLTQSAQGTQGTFSWKRCLIEVTSLFSIVCLLPQPLRDRKDSGTTGTSGTRDRTSCRSAVGSGKDGRQLTLRVVAYSVQKI